MLKYKSADELGQLCGAFEVMRSELMQSNCELWQRAEDRKRLNAAFAHDLRNPITVIKGAVTLLRADDEDNPAVQQLATHISRIEQYVDLMSSVQRLEDVTVCRQPVSGSALRQNIAETGKALAAGCKVDVLVEHLPDEVNLDSDLFCHVAENLLANAARFAAGRITVTLTADAEWLTLCVADDGAGYPAQLLMEGPQPFGRCGDAPEHFGMGLYICNVICGKHGGSLYLQNSRQGGAVAAAKFGIK